jgi:anti-sigma regulatory factor (Ser/Thr protein kinase)
VGEARRTAASLAQSIGFDEIVVGQVAIVATELAGNMVRHAKSGEMIVRSLPGAGGKGPGGMEILAIDRGPGFANVLEAQSDGYSTGSTPGTGLGAVKRLSALSEVYSEPPRGTVVVSQFHLRSRPTGMEFGAVCLPKPGEESCGDSWGAESSDAGSDGGDRTVMVVADGLGHGSNAATASQLAIRAFRENAHLTSMQIAEAIHAALRSTRGAAVAVCELLRGKKQVCFTGIGNISAMIITGTATRNMVSHNGTAGAEVRRIQTFTYPWEPESMIIMHSDGLSSQWHLAQHVGLRFKHPSVIAGVLYRDCRRERDDVTVLVAKDRT